MCKTFVAIKYLNINYTNIIFERTLETSFPSWGEEFYSSESLIASVFVKSSATGALDPFIELCIDEEFLFLFFHLILITTFQGR